MVVNEDFLVAEKMLDGVFMSNRILLRGKDRFCGCGHYCGRCIKIFMS